MNTSTTAAHAQQCAHSPAAQAVYSVKDFCAAHQISKVAFYDLLKKGIGPRIMKVGTRTLISLEAAAEWRRRMEEGAQVMPGRRTSSH